MSKWQGRLRQRDKGNEWGRETDPLRLLTPYFINIYRVLRSSRNLQEVKGSLLRLVSPRHISLLILREISFSLQTPIIRERYMKFIHSYWNYLTIMSTCLKCMKFNFWAHQWLIRVFQNIPEEKNLFSIVNNKGQMPLLHTQHGVSFMLPSWEHQSLEKARSNSSTMGKNTFTSQEAKL